MVTCHWFFFVMGSLHQPFDACSIVAGITCGDLHIQDIIKDSLERCHSVQQHLNPFTAIYDDEAIETAEASALRLRNGAAIRPLEGVPVAIKEFTPIKGMPTTRGSAALKDRIATDQPVLVQRLLDAGAIIVARTTTPEFAHSSFTRSPLYGHTKNPFDASKTCGGSSGGSAVAVSTGCVPLAEGTDMGGSVRIPAALSGCVGFKPSFGRIPMDILPTVFDTISHFGPLARTIEDIKLFMNVVSGPDNRDILSQVSPQDLDQPDFDPKTLKLAVSPDLGFFEIDADVAHAFDQSLSSLADAGAELAPVDLGWGPEIVDAWYDYWCVYLAAAAEDLLDDHRQDMDPEFLALVDRGLSMSAVAFRRIDEVRTKQWRQFSNVMTGFDALLCPTMALPAPPLHASENDFTAVNTNGRLAGLDMTCMFNSIGQCPALSVPSGLSKDGLPLATQIIGNRFDDATTLNIGQLLQNIHGWNHISPPNMSLYSTSLKTT